MIVLLSKTEYDIEINDVVTKMYLNQKSFLFNVKELSYLLVRDANQRLFSSDKDTFSSNK